MQEFRSMTTGVFLDDLIRIFVITIVLILVQSALQTLRLPEIQREWIGLPQSDDYDMPSVLVCSVGNVLLLLLTSYVYC